MSYSGVLVFNIEKSWEEFYPVGAAHFTIVPQSDLFRFLYLISQRMTRKRVRAFCRGFQLRICCNQSDITSVEVFAISVTGTIHSIQVKFLKEEQKWEETVYEPAY